MDVTEISIMHHLSLVFLVLWLLSFFNLCHPVAFLVSFVYLFLVHERYIVRLRRKLQFDERKQANQRRVLCDSETVRWLNLAVEKMWPICMEHITSQKILLAIVPWFLEKYKPWTAREAVVQSMYLGRNPPMFTQIRVLSHTIDDHLVLELGMNFCTADDMSTILAVKLRKRLGFGMWAKLHITGMHIEGKVLVGVKFLRGWPFIGRLRVCFAEPPYFQMTVKPIFTHGLDVTVLPGIAGWLDKLLSVAFEQTLVQPNMLVVDVEKFASPNAESWFSVDEKEPIAFVKVEVIEASDMKPSDLNGLADPYVKGQLGPYRFRTKIHRKTLSPKWQEEFKIPILSWDSPNVLAIEVRDKDHFVDDTLGDCSININELRDCDRHDMWLPLQNIKIGRVHVAVTVLDESLKGVNMSFDGETLMKEDTRDSFAVETVDRTSVSSRPEDKPTKVSDNFEPINVEGQQQTGIWIHQPGSEVLQTWTPRKGKSRRLDNEVQSVPSTASGPLDSSSSDGTGEDKQRTSRVRRGWHKIEAVFHRGPRKEDHSSNNGGSVHSPYSNIKAVDQKAIGVRLVVEENMSVPISRKDLTDAMLSPEGGRSQSPDKGNMKGMAKSILKHAEKSARSFKHVISRKGSNKSRGDSSIGSDKAALESSSSDDESLSSLQDIKTPTGSTPTSNQDVIDDSLTPSVSAVHDSSNQPARNTESQIEKSEANGQDNIPNNKSNNSKDIDTGPEDSSKLQPSEEKLREEKN